MEQQLPVDGLHLRVLEMKSCFGHTTGATKTSGLRVSPVGHGGAAYHQSAAFYGGPHLAVESVATEGELRDATGLDNLGLDHRVGELRLVVHIVVVPVRQRIASGEAGLTACAPARRAAVVLAAHVQYAANRPVAAAGGLAFARSVGGGGLALPRRGGGAARHEQRKHRVATRP